MHDKSYLVLVHDILRSAIDQMNAKLEQTAPALAQTLDDVKGGIDLSSCRPRFETADARAADRFDDMTKELVSLGFNEAALR